MICKICKKGMGSITYKHLRTHHITTIEYKNKFLGSKLSWNSDLTKETDKRVLKISNSLKGNKNSLGNPCYRTPEHMGQERYDKSEVERIEKLRNYLKDGGSPLNDKGVHSKAVATRKARYPNYFSSDGLKTIRENNGNKNRLASMTPEEKIKYGNIRSEIETKWWASRTPEEKSDMFRKIFTRREPSGPETCFQNNYIDKYNLPFIYTGQIKDKKIDIGGKIPDFLHLFKKKIIEIYGNCYHLGDNLQDRIDHFKKFDYDCLIIWASELKNEDLVLDKIRRFESF